LEMFSTIASIASRLALADTSTFFIPLKKPTSRWKTILQPGAALLKTGLQISEVYIPSLHVGHVVQHCSW
jgi:hypothetical protein